MFILRELGLDFCNGNGEGEVDFSLLIAFRLKVGVVCLCVGGLKVSDLEYALLAVDELFVHRLLSFDGDEHGRRYPRCVADGDRLSADDGHAEWRMALLSVILSCIHRL